MTTSRKIKKIEIYRLQEMFDYKIDFSGDGNTAIIIAPNGYGKTAFLSVINACLQFRLSEAVGYRFDRLIVEFDDGTHWAFKKTAAEPPKSEGGARNIRPSVTHRRHRRVFIEFTSYDEKGKPRKIKPAPSPENVPVEVLARALERNLPVSRVAYDKFHDRINDDVVTWSMLYDRYSNSLLHDVDFRARMGEYAQYFMPSAEEKFNCVFIETQRLLLTQKATRAESEATSAPQEEINRQASYLASLLQKTYASYTTTSQELDRSFPNRLVSRAERSIAPNRRNVDALKNELDEIEAKRRALTDAGILVDTSEALVAPKDEIIASVTDALEIYVEDSKKKLATFDDLFNKVSAFRDLLAKKLRPKTLTINAEKGVEVRRGKDGVGLDKLSSGEKHEFVMMFKLIFETPINSLVLIDEPEISLHVSWQLEFMPDLARIQSVNDFQCVIATHSPQIIQGADSITFDLSEQA